MKVFVFALLVCSALAMPTISEDGAETYNEVEDNGRNYNFQWAVKDSSEELDFGHSEEKEDGKVEGSYYVLLPDGRTQKVKYYVDGDSGYVAEVSYSGEAEEYGGEEAEVAVE